jgi:hypothetical protein
MSKAEKRLETENRYPDRNTSLVPTNEFKQYIMAALLIKQIVEDRMSPRQAREHIKKVYNDLKRTGIL